MEKLNNRDLVTTLVRRLHDLGVAAHIEGLPLRTDLYTNDLRIDLQRGGSHQDYLLQLRQTVKPSEVRTFTDQVQASAPMILGVGTAVSQQTAKALRAVGLQYIDVVGNASLVFGDVYIEVSGRRPAELARPRPASGTGNLFSTARAQVIFAMLQWPRLWHGSQRATADAAGVSLGQANSALTMLRILGFEPGGHRPVADLLDLWVTAFPTGLGEKLMLGRYRGSGKELTKVQTEDAVFTSGEPLATSLLQPQSLVVYVDHLDPMLPVVNRWRSDGEPNITVRRKFWTTPPHGTHDYDGPLTGIRPAPALLVYADLMSSDDPRVREVADEWRPRLVGPDFHT